MSVHPRDLHAAGPALLSGFARPDEGRVSGHVLDPADPARRFAVEIVLDGLPIALVRAERFDRDLLRAGHGDGCYGFVHALDRGSLGRHARIEARLANLDVAVGAPIDLSLDEVAPRPEAGSVSWTSGRRLFGAVPRRPDGTAPRVRILEGGDCVAETDPQPWAVTREAGLPGHLCPWSLHLPETIADGRVHRLRVVDAGGTELDGSPVAVLAHPDGLGAALAAGLGSGDELRADWADRLVPSSVPFREIEAWRARLPRPDLPAGERSVRVVLVGEAGTEAAIRRLGTQARCAWSAAVVPVSDGFVRPEDLAEAATPESGGAAVVAFLRTGTVLEPDGLAALAAALAAAPDADVVLCDFEVDGPDGPEPCFLGAYDEERQLEQGIGAHVFVARRDAVAAALAARPTSLPALLLALVGAVGGDRVLHRPGLLARIEPPTAAGDVRAVAAASLDHLSRSGIPATARLGVGRLFPAVRVRRELRPGTTVSCVIPTRNRLDLLEPCLRSLRASASGLRPEIVIVDNGSSCPDTLAFLDELSAGGGRVVREPGPFNFARLCNRGVAAASGELVCLLNDDVEALETGWLDELASRLADPEVGAAGAILRWPNGIVQHGGVVLGPGFLAADAFNDRAAGDPGPGDLLRVARDVSAATGACLMLRRAEYEEIGGMDEVAFPILFNDVDLCLRLRAGGRRIVLTPHLTLLHRESASRGRDETPAARGRYRRETAELRRRWGEALAADPCYNPCLNLDPYPFSALAVPVRPLAARTRTLPGSAWTPAIRRPPPD